MQTFSRLLVISAALAAAAASQAFTIAGTTQGFFNAGVGSNVATLGGLTFNTGTFNANTSQPTGGFYGIGSLGGVLSGSLGTFTLANSTFNYTGSTFTLLVSFTLPTATQPQGAPYQATLLGQVTQNIGGGVFINFTGTQLMTFPGGQFTLSVLPLAIGPSSDQNRISGFGVASTVPGPSALAAFGIGALAKVRRRRRSA